MRSVRNMLSVLEAFDLDHPELGVSEIATRLSIPASSVHRLLAALVDRGYVRATPTRRYCLDLKLMELGSLVLHHRGFDALIQPFFEKLGAASKETTNVAVLDGDEILYVAVRESKELLRPNYWVGQRGPAYETALGKANIAFSRDPSEWPGEKWQELDEVRRSGAAYDIEESQAGVSCVGVPLLSRDGKAFAGLSISGPTTRLTKERMEAFLPLLKETAEAMAEAIARNGSLTLYSHTQRAQR